MSKNDAPQSLGVSWAAGSLGAGRSEGSPGAIRVVYWKWGFLVTQEHHDPQSWIRTLFVVDGVKAQDKETISTPKSTGKLGKVKQNTT